MFTAHPMDSEPNCNAVNITQVHLPWIFQKTPTAVFCCCWQITFILHSSVRSKPFSNKNSIFARNLVKRVFFAAIVRVRTGKQTLSLDCKQMAGCQFVCWYISQQGQSSRRHISAWKDGLCAARLMPAPSPPWWRQKVKRSVAFIRCKVQ